MDRKSAFRFASVSFRLRKSFLSMFAIVEHPTQIIPLETIDNPFWINAIRTLFYACPYARTATWNIDRKTSKPNKNRANTIKQILCKTAAVSKYYNSSKVFDLRALSLCVYTCSVLYCVSIKRLRVFLYINYATNVFLDRTSHVEHLLH